MVLKEMILSAGMSKLSDKLEYAALVYCGMSLSRCLKIDCKIHQI